ncbi:CocE/NonD family hydrolase [Acidobacteriota bacterium]
MNHKDRFITSLKLGEPDRVPYFDYFDPESIVKIGRLYQAEVPEIKFGIDYSWAEIHRLNEIQFSFIKDMDIDAVIPDFSSGAERIPGKSDLIKDRHGIVYQLSRHGESFAVGGPVKGIKNGVDETSVEYFVLGDNVWKSATQWPPANVKPQKWYFHSEGEAHRLTTNGKLKREAPANKEPRDIYTYDPRDPAPNWMSFDQMKGWQDVQTFPYDFQNIEKRSDIAVYTSEPLKEDLTIAGDVIVELYASCDVLDTDWWAYISDVHPDGSSIRYSLGMIRARFRNIEDKVHNVFGENFIKEELLTGSFEDVVKYIISVPSIALTFKKGHKVRIAITNACDNYGFPNSNTGKDEALVTETIVGKMAIHHSPDYLSCVILPILPKN